MAPPKLAITCSINKKDVVGLSLEEEALMRQWIEYKKVIIDRQPITENILSVGSVQIWPYSQLRSSFEWLYAGTWLSFENQKLYDW